VVLVIFRNRLRGENPPGYETVANRMVALAQQQPGFRAIKTFTADDGERVTISEFDSIEAVNAWRANVEHLEAQRRGRSEFYAEYLLQTCELLREKKFSAR